MSTQRQKDLDAIDKSIATIQKKLHSKIDVKEKTELIELLEQEIDIRAIVLIDKYEKLTENQWEYLKIVRNSHQL